MFSLQSCCVRRVFFLLLWAVCSSIPAYAACSDAYSLALGETATLGDVAPEQTLHFAVYADEAGILNVEVAGALDSAAPALDRAESCDGSQGRGTVLFQGLNRLVMKVEAGRHDFRVAAQNLSSPVFQVRARAILQLSHKTEEDPDEVDVDPFQAPIRPCQWSKEEDPDEVDVDPFSGDGSQGSMRRRIRLGRASGSGLWALRIEHPSATVALFDRLGHRLAVGDEGLQRLLPAGEYWLELETRSRLGEPGKTVLQITRW